jgi:hypothetical protein
MAENLMTQHSILRERERKRRRKEFLLRSTNSSTIQMDVRANVQDNSHRNVYYNLDKKSFIGQLNGFTKFLVALGTLESADYGLVFNEALGGGLGRVLGGDLSSSNSGGSSGGSSGSSDRHSDSGDNNSVVRSLSDSAISADRDGAGGGSVSSSSSSDVPVFKSYHSLKYVHIPPTVRVSTSDSTVRVGTKKNLGGSKIFYFDRLQTGDTFVLEQGSS